MKDFAKFFPWLVVAVSVLALVFAMVPPGTPPGKMNLQELGGLPVVDGGRIKPLDTVARTTLMVVSSRQTYTDDKGQTQQAIKWFLEVMTNPDAAMRQKVFRIENDQVLSMLGLEARPGSYRYAINEFIDKIDLIRDRAIAAQKVKPDQRDIFQNKIIEFAKHLELYSEVARLEAPLMVPPREKGEKWQSLLQSMAEFKQTGVENPAALSLATLLQSYRRDDAQKFNQTLDDYRKQVEAQRPSESRRTDFEVFFNHFEPFYQCTLIYVFVFLLACLSWFGWSSPLIRSAFWLTVVALVVHTWALLARMYLMERWGVFVMNLYSTAVFIGWTCVLLGLLLEWLFPIGIGVVVASVGGAVTALISHHLAAGGDTLEVLQAVLDTNLWLATHVTCINLGYGATFVAGILGILYILRGVLTPSLDKTTAKALTTMLYGVVCFATLLSFTGTVLGGIWADQSWGRFWGWDPKENGALLIVIWNALILHARWGGMVQARGMAVLSVVGNMVTGWSWFGTNQLQVGLHSYGFSNTLAVGLVIGWALHAVVLGMGLLPMRWWRSYSALTAAKAPPVESEAPPPPETPHGKRRGKRGAKRGDAGYFPGPA
jgi:ABC-type transport system involved in cytochrome c biogenesis permease subunit